MHRSHHSAIGVWAGIACMLAGVAGAEPFTFQTPGGPVTIELTHAGPDGDLVAPGAPEAPAFRPPAIFTAPLPSGSGARALGFAGAFTAVADDATAASWNPAGLTQLERPEGSVVYRVSSQRHEHHSDAEGFAVGTDEFDSENINYLSAVFPFHFVPLHRNAVVSLNYQEAYDFTQAFSADLSASSAARAGSSDRQVFQEVQVDAVKDDIFDIEIRSYKTTEVVSTVDQLLANELVSDLSYEQEGVIAAVSPAFALDVTPKLALGLALNWYGNDVLSGNRIHSKTTAAYTGASLSSVNIGTTRTTSGTYEYDGRVLLPAGGQIPVPIVVPVDDGGRFDTFSDSSGSHRNDDVVMDGVFEEINDLEGVNGFNTTLGVMWTVSRVVGLGATVDLPWTAEAEQTQTTRNRATTYNAARTQVLGSVDDTTVVQKDIEMEFPLFWACGMVLRWTPEFYTTFDLSQTQWSDFSFQAEGEPRINPLDGSPHGENPLDDTWAARVGTEYLILTRQTEIPLRAGFAWEERPALGEPDDYYLVSLGSGFSLGRDPGRVIVDVAYILTLADGVRGIVPEQSGLTSDVQEHEGYVSVIKHF